MSKRRASMPPAASSAPNSSRNGSGNRRPLPGAARSMAAAPVTCRQCGCLNFSSRDRCDSCRSGARSPPAPARRSAPAPASASASTSAAGVQFFARRGSSWSSRGGGRQGTARREGSAEDSERSRAGERARSEGQAQQQEEQEVIDLISDDDEDEDEPMPSAGGGGREEAAVERVAGREQASASDPPVAASAERADAGRAAKEEEEEEEEEKEKETPALFMSRVFADVSFSSTDFPTEKEANAARKRSGRAAAAKRTDSVTGSEASTADSAATISLTGDADSGGHERTEPPRSSSPPSAVTAVNQAEFSTPAAVEAVEPAAEVVEEPQSAAAVPPVSPSVYEPEEQRAADVEQTVEAPSSAAASSPVNPVAAGASEPATAPGSSNVASKKEEDEGEGEEEEEEEGEGSPWMSRVFDAVPFDSSDFPGLEALPAARRSHPPRPAAQASSESRAVGDAPRASSHDSSSGEPPSVTPTVEAAPPSAPASAAAASTMPVVPQAAAAAAPPPDKPSLPPSPQVKQEPPARVPFYRQVQKPSALGECSADFLMFVRECGGESYEEDDDEWHQQQLQLLDVVDLTNLSDSEGENDSDDDVEVLGVASTGSVLSPAQSNGASDANGIGAASTGSVPPAPKRAAPVKAECMVCEERRSVRMMTQCFKCKKYYHKRCARELGEVRCWECEPGEMIDEMIDDSELTEATHEETVRMLRVLRQDPSSPSDESGEGDEAEVEGEGEGEQIEEVGTNQGGDLEGDDDGDHEMEDVGEDNPLVSGRPTRSEWRWSTFVNNATASLEADFREVTQSIERDMASDEGRARYSRGFVTREEFSTSMDNVVNHYVEVVRKRARVRQLAQAQAQAEAQAQALADAQAQAQSEAQGPTPAPGQTQVQEQDGAPGSAGTGGAATPVVAASVSEEMPAPPPPTGA